MAIKTPPPLHAIDSTDHPMPALHSSLTPPYLLEGFSMEHAWLGAPVGVALS